MKILLDECVPKDLRLSFVGHECQTVPKAGFAGKKNGELLTLAEAAGFVSSLLSIADCHINRI
jgi:hypothetical protein